MDGIINLNKPRGISSAQALYRVRAITAQRKSGHAGTLDPAASGVLVLCLGKATKLVEKLMDQPKVYRATARLDVTSESFDLGRPLIPVDVAKPPHQEQVVEALARLEGETQQVPPIVSAIKIRGVPAYKRALSGETLHLKARPVRIYWIVLHRYDWPEIDFELACGRGTYVRALIRDLGVQLGSGGCLASLVRSRVGPFAIDSSSTLDQLETVRSPSEYLVDLEKARRWLDQPPSVPPHPLEENPM